MGDLPRRSKHRRKILRTIWSLADGHCQSDTYIYGNHDSNTYSNTECDANGYRNRYSFSDAHSGAYFDSKTDAYAEVCANAKGSPDSAAETGAAGRLKPVDIRR